MERPYHPCELVIFDYSGTLSVEAPAFGRPENLVPALAESGLAACGVATSEIFWEQIVFPTWDDAGRTKIGFARSMANRIAELGLSNADPAMSPPFPKQTSPPLGGELPCASIAEAAERFVFLYLAHSRPEPLWRPLLEKLHADSMFFVLIATDHYAEATSAIVRYLRDWGIAAESMGNGVSSTGMARSTGLDNPPLPHFLVANSADLGFWKAERPFWEIVKEGLPYSFRHILLVDDFGFNEADVAGYGMLSRVRKRSNKTKTVLKEVFQTGVSVLPFWSQRNDAPLERDMHERILKTTAKIEEILWKYNETRIIS